MSIGALHLPKKMFMLTVSVCTCLVSALIYVLIVCLITLL